MRPILACLVFAALAAADPTTITVDGKPAFTCQLPAGWKAAATGDKTTIIPVQHAPHIQVWPVASATVTVAEKDVAALIVSEVKDFVTTSRTDLKVAGAPAEQLIGTGSEADDGDPANAEVTIFALGKQVYVLVSHGEGKGASERHAEIQAVLNSIKAGG